MRESNFSNPVQNKACVCISAAVYDRRAIDCTATLPLINSLNHLAYLTSTSPRIREMVCLDGGLERLIRILRQVPRAPPQPALRGVITKEMQAIWKWSLAFQCVVNIGVRGSENVRTRVVEAGMIPVAVRVLESYLRIADAIREEKKREAKREEAKQRLERAAEVALLSMPDVTTPTASGLRRGAISHSEGREEAEGGSRSSTAMRSTTASDAPAMESYIAASTSGGSVRSSRDVLQTTSSLPAARTMETGTPLVTTLDANSVISPSSSSSSVLADTSMEQALSSHGPSEDRQDLVAGYPSGLLTNVSSVEDFTASASGSDGAEDAEMEGEESEMDLTQTERSRETSQSDMQDTYEAGDGSTPRPPRRMLAPLAVGEQRRELPTAWQVMSEGATSVTPVREATVMATPRRSNHNGSDTRRLPLTTNEQTPGNVETVASEAERMQATAGRAHHHHHHHHHHRERPNQGDNVLHASDMIYREEEVLLSLQLLAYLSKYAHVRTLFHCDLSLLNSLETLDGSITGALRDSIQSWNPMHPTKKNVFCIAERYTLRSSRTGLCHFAAHGESRVAPEIQYWAGVIMRNACRKDENQGGIRQCANMLCGKWEKQPREFAKCRRCRKAKYCSKQCQSKGWQMGHRFWCSARNDDEHPDTKDKNKEKLAAAGVEATQEGQTQGETDDEGVPRPVQDAQRRNTTSAVEGAAIQQQLQVDSRSHLGHAHASPAPLFTGGRTQHRGYPGEAPRRHASTSSSATTLQPPSSGRRVVSAIPTHLQPPSSDDLQTGGSRSRTVSAASSGGEMSDMSDDEMERASRRVLANTISPAQRSPGVNLTPLAAMTTAEEAFLLSMNSAGTDNAGNLNATAAGMVPTRTDLAGRPLPPPVIAHHDAGMDQNIGVTGGDLLGMGGRLTPGVHEEHENAVFGRGDIDQMIWRGRTPAAEEQEQSRDTRRRGSTVTGRNMAYHQRDTQQQEEEEERSSNSLLNSALLLAGTNSTNSSSNNSSSVSYIASPSGQSRTMSASTRCPSSGSLHAPIARQPHRFASVAATISPVASSSRSSGALHSFVRGSLAGTFGDWRTSSSPIDTDSNVDVISNPTSTTFASYTNSGTAMGLNGSNSSRSRSSIGRNISAPAHSGSFDSGVQDFTARRVQDDFLVPSDIQDLLNTVESSDEMQLDSA